MTQNDEPLEEEPIQPEQTPPSEPQPEPESQQKKRFGTGEPIYLYVKTSPTTYDNVGEFPSRVDASREAETSWRGHQYKTLSASEAIAEQQKLQARHEKVQRTVQKVEKVATKVGSGLSRVAKNITRNAESEARSRGMLPPPRAPPSQSVNVNTQQPDFHYDDLKRFGQNINERYNPGAKNFKPDIQDQPRQQRFMVQKPESKFSFAPPESPIKKFKHTLNPPPSMIKPSNMTLSPPVPSGKQYGVRQQHGSFMFQNRIQPYRIPVTSLFPQRAPAPVEKKFVHHKKQKSKKRKK